MSIFYRATDKEIFEVKKKIFIEKGIPLLFKNDFVQSPFLGSCFGKYDSRLHVYDFIKLTEDSLLQQITVNIFKGDNWIQIYLNIFQLDSSIKSIQQLKTVDGIKFSMPPNSISNMRLHVDDFKGIPLFNYDSMFRNHKLKSSWTKFGFKKSVEKLEQRIETDLSDFDKYVRRWNKIFSPLKTTIDGEIIGLKNLTIDERLKITRLTKRFNEAKHKNKVYATNVLKWLEIDDLEIKKILSE